MFFSMTKHYEGFFSGKGNQFKSYHPLKFTIGFKMSLFHQNNGAFWDDKKTTFSIR